ncbi:MAG: hypothetical protein R3B48_02585 [Kofleriaceae bacterium]
MTAPRVDRTASAPGKLILAGEYAVLEGGTAVVIAVDRRATARAGTREPSPFLDALHAALVARHGAEHPRARRAAALTVDTAAFASHGRKLGLGSSAAATVAAAALALAAEGEAPDAAEVFELAAAAHGDAQGRRGARGSGADLAACTYGGALAFARRGGDVSIEPLPAPRSITLLPFFTGHSADTVTLVGRVRAAGAAVAPCLDAIARAADALASALRRDDAEAIRGAIRDGGDALAALGERAGVDLETPAVRAARQALAPLGAAVKTTGAGGGDLAIAALAPDADPGLAAEALARAGCEPLPLGIDLCGVDLRPQAL